MLQVAHTFVCTFSPFSLVRSGLSCGHLRMRIRYFTNFQQVIKLSPLCDRWRLQEKTKTSSFVTAIYMYN